MNSKNVIVYKASPVKEDSDCYPARIVLWEHPENPLQLFATHIEVLPPGQEPYFILGHYDMDINRAVSDYKKRVKQL